MPRSLLAATTTGGASIEPRARPRSMMIHGRLSGRNSRKHAAKASRCRANTSLAATTRCSNRCQPAAIARRNDVAAVDMTSRQQPLSATGLKCALSVRVDFEFASMKYLFSLSRAPPPYLGSLAYLANVPTLRGYGFTIRCHRGYHFTIARLSRNC